MKAKILSLIYILAAWCMRLIVTPLAKLNKKLMPSNINVKIKKAVYKATLLTYIAECELTLWSVQLSKLVEYEKFLQDRIDAAKAAYETA